MRRGGGHIFAKRNRDYSYRLPRKALQAATRMAMASKVEDDQVTLVDGFGLEQPKTKQAVAMLQALGVGDGGVVRSDDNGDFHRVGEGWKRHVVIGMSSH